MNFASVQADPTRAARIVGFDHLDANLASGDLPNFALIAPTRAMRCTGCTTRASQATATSANHACYRDF